MQFGHKALPLNDHKAAVFVSQLTLMLLTVGFHIDALYICSSDE
jgi:hypothetical protein